MAQAEYQQEEVKDGEGTYQYTTQIRENSGDGSAAAMGPSVADL
jgi:hypothetical protein